MKDLNQHEDAARIDRLFVDLFEEDKRGAEVFDVLFRKFAGQAKAHTEGGIDAVLRTYRGVAFREVLDYIVMRCNRARGIDDTPDSGDVPHASQQGG